jgi:cytochrome c-type biogenesis protein CcmH
MATFILLAVALTAAAVAVVAVPLLRRDGARGSPALLAAVSAGGVIVIGGAVLYATWSTWSWRAPEASTTPQNMVANLARKLERNPNDLEGWLTLGRSYSVLEQYPAAARAFQRANVLAGGKNVQALVGQAEALAMIDENELDGRAGRMIEEAIALDPQNGKALFYGAASALRRNDLPLARQRFAAILAFNPPANVRPILEEQIAAIDQRLAGGAPSPADSAAAQQGPAPASGASSGSAASATAAVRVTVKLAPALGAAVPPSMPLFVIVRDPKQPGPPLAVKRLSSQFPQTVELTNADSMIAGRSFAPDQQVEVVARIARSGSALGGTGDPVGQVAYHVGRDGLVDIVIDRLTP